jgi:hypothetical protein
MSIDARVESVFYRQNGTGHLNLIDRPAKEGQTAGIAGQMMLHFEHAPRNVFELVGTDIWGGDSGIMLGEVEIAKRNGYTGIVFEGYGTIAEAVGKFLRKQTP